MKSILEDMYYGNLRPDESIKSADPRAKQLHQEVMMLMDNYQKKLAAAEFEEIERLLDLVGELNSMHAAAAFVQGYRMGALMITEVYCG
ncbi:hypothetical protein JI735_28820 [Paenibacillus sonchi]|uniref:Uncharacterized protein n=1 Tax=Paenibacillus sonchi TaxID=373687 RepID=A0A974PBR3_9BACL|nr:DUF6809 family protein [Paenibacillus sonchi]QQZ60458.1 hypothetical protein JI735_28820 [Paenibacillus sonchi]